MLFHHSTSPILPLGATLFAAVALSQGCGGSFDDGDCPGGCPGGQECVAGRCVELRDGPCERIICPSGRVCEGGICVAEDSEDPCDQIRCASEDQVCQNGTCIFADQDTDGDGFRAAEECDDTNAAVYPGAAEVCDGLNNDCDDSTGDGLDDGCEGFCCGEPPACQFCCSPEQCGDGDWSCATMICECAGVEVDGECLGGASCTPGDADWESQPCGSCGTQSRSRACDAAGAWGGWSAWGDCEDGACSPGDTDRESQPCGDCGSQSRNRTCGDDCNWGAWGSWGACAGQGVCGAGDTDSESQPCGDCGSQSRSRTCGNDCSWGSWGAWSACAGEGECDPDLPPTVEYESCGTCGGGEHSRSRECTASCEWGAWGAWSPCIGDVYCVDFLDREVCPGSTGLRPCPREPDGQQRCTCSALGYWTDCSDACTM